MGNRSGSILGRLCPVRLKPGQHGVRRSVRAQLPGEQKVAEADGHETQENQADQRIEPGHRYQAYHRQHQRDERDQWVARRAESPLQIRLAFAQLEQTEHAHDVHHDRAEHRHGDHRGSEGHAAEVDQAVAVDRGDADDAAGDDRPVRRLEARQFCQRCGQIAGAGEGEELARVAKNDPVKARYQAEQPDPYQHVQPAGVFADHGFHRLRQWVVDV